MKKINKIDDNYDEYENPDSSIKEGIKNIPKDTSNFYNGTNMYMGNSREMCKVDRHLNDEQILCIGESGKYFICTQKYIDDGIKSLHNINIHKKFSLYENIKPIFNKLYDDTGYQKIELKNSKYSDKYWFIQVNFKGSQIINDLYNIKVISGICDSEPLPIKYLHNGNFAIKTYQFKYEDYLNNKPKTRKDFFNDLIKLFPKGKYERFNNKWFCGDKCFIINEKTSDNSLVDISVLENKNGKSYKNYRRKIIKPKSVIPATFNDFLSEFIHIVNDAYIPGDDTKLDLSKYTNTNNDKIITYTKKVNENEFIQTFDFTDDKELKKLTKKMTQSNADKILSYVNSELRYCDLPSYSFEKGEKQPEWDNYVGLVKLPNNVYLSFEVEEGDAEEITWAHSIYSTDIANLIIL